MFALRCLLPMPVILLAACDTLDNMREAHLYNGKTQYFPLAQKKLAVAARKSLPMEEIGLTRHAPPPIASREIPKVAPRAPVDTTAQDEEDRRFLYLNPDDLAPKKAF